MPLNENPKNKFKGVNALMNDNSVGLKGDKESLYDVDINVAGKDIGYNAVPMGGPGIPSQLTERYKLEMGPAGPYFGDLQAKEYDKASSIRSGMTKKLSPGGRAEKLAAEESEEEMEMEERVARGFNQA